MSTTQSMTVEELLQKLNEMIEKKPITKQMTICLSLGPTGMRDATEVKMERERDGKPVRPFVLLR